MSFLNKSKKMISDNQIKATIASNNKKIVAKKGSCINFDYKSNKVHDSEQQEVSLAKEISNCLIKCSNFRNKILSCPNCSEKVKKYLLDTKTNISNQIKKLQKNFEHEYLNGSFFVHVPTNAINQLNNEFEIINQTLDGIDKTLLCNECKENLTNLHQAYQELIAYKLVLNSKGK